MTTRDEVYNYLTAILDSNSFEKNDKNKKIAIKQKLSKEEMDGLVCHLTNLLGQNIIQNPEEKGFNNYRFNSRFINIDNDSIKIDKYGRIYVDINAFLNEDNIVEKILSNPEFTNKIKSYFEPEDLQIKFIIRKLLNNSFFLTAIVNLVTAIQKVEGFKEETLQQLIDEINTETKIYDEPQQEEPETPVEEPSEEPESEPEPEEHSTTESTIKYLCQFCNKEVSEEDTVCPHCGADLLNWKPIRA